MEESIHLNPIEDTLIGAYGKYMYFKAEGGDYIVAVKDKTYYKILKEFIKTKRDFCERYDHFCGVWGEFASKKVERLEDLVLNEYIDVEDNDINDGLEEVKVTYPVYLVREFVMQCDMEHG